MIHLGSLYSICYVLYWTANFPSNIALHVLKKMPAVPNNLGYLCVGASGASELGKFTNFL